MDFLVDFLSVITQTVSTVLGSLGTSALAFFDGAFTTALDGSISSLGVMAGVVIGLGLLGSLMAWVKSKI